MAKSNKFKIWFADKRQFLFSWYTKDSQETQEPEKSLLELPPTLRKKLVDLVENLHSHPADRQAIASNLDEAYELWRDNPSNANNSIVILSSPVAAVSRIPSETLEEWAKKRQVPLKLLPFQARPTDTKSPVSKLEHYLKSDSTPDSATQQPEIVVTPNLSWCFLRSMKGLAGIEYIRSLMCDGSKNRFWIIGAGQVGWQYLNSVSSLEAYCGTVFSLPAIKPEELEKWLESIVQELDMVFDDPRIDKQILDGDKDNKTNYFDCLADISQGIGSVAVPAFLKSIHYEKVDRENEQEIKPEQKSVVAQIPELPELPDLDSTAQYILYSLLLHGDLTIGSLAQSLGDLESEVQARVQLLRSEGIVEQQDKIIKINPIHYQRIKQNLAGNNFIIER